MPDSADSYPRREFLARTLVGAPAAALSFLSSKGHAQPSPADDSPFDPWARNALLHKGQVINESVEFVDSLTGRSSRRLTQYRLLNEQPTYHLGACFSPDSRYQIVSTELRDGSTALLRAEVATGELTVLETAPKGWKLGVWNACVVPSLNAIVAIVGNQVKLYDFNTLRERIVLENVLGLHSPTGSCDGHRLFVMKRAAAVSVEGVKTVPAIYCEIDLANGDMREIFRETRSQSNHLVPCPTDPDLLLIDRDLPPKFGGGGDGGRTSRVWILHAKTARLTEIRPNDSNRFQIHSNWSHCGQYVYYHGTSRQHSYPTSPSGHYIGVADREGRVVWERHFPTFFYGHVSAHTQTPAILSDALLTKNLITAIHWKELNAQEVPRIEILACHATNWVPGQASHPHPHMSPDGKWLSYNRGTTAGPLATDRMAPALKDIYGDAVGFAPQRSDVCVVRL